ncbi:DedA family protein [Riemerella columbipharyngis]|uniref:Membrane-associated protein n=1 Tax=Riemerella columbipharyngis TaxID=1071918 RepID=A0A1G6YNF9_9FLAO|nr:VTT domain-containing protein [Riemerella columbipharyngis]SDD92064.1 membrane-associated protein [Riemerella columbipharyngis]
MDHLNSWKDLLNPEFYIQLGGYWLVLFIIFAETGLFIGFFLPGDSLLFISGIYAKDMIEKTFGTTESDFLDTTLMAISIAIAAILGNMVGYWFGKKSGPALYERPDSFIFKKKYLFKAHDFYEEHGKIAIIAARFLPIIRTFAPIVAGIVGMEKGKFMLYNIIGAVAWAFTLIFMGHYLNVFFQDQLGIDMKKHLEIIILFIVLITTAPVLFKMFFSKNKA